MPVAPLFAAALCGTFTLAGLGAAAASPPLAAYRGTSRVLLVSAPKPDDAALLRQRATFSAMGAAARERDLVLVEAVGAAAPAQALRAAFDLDPGRFTAVLVGKDGGGKLRSHDVLGADQLIPLIDAMPMRQDEMRRRTQPEL